MTVSKIALAMGALALVAAALGSLVACLPVGKTPVDLASVSEATGHRAGTTVTFTGVARTDVRGIDVYGTKHPKSVGRKEFDHHEMWVVPVDDAAGSPTDPVTLWVTPSMVIPEGQDPSPWFDQLKAEFDGKPQTLKVRGSADESKAGWAKAIADAETRHGVRSDPKAIVVPWPPKG